MINYKMVI